MWRFAVMILNTLKISEGLIEISVNYNSQIVEKLRQIPGRKWIADRKVWSFPDNKSTIAMLIDIFGDVIEKPKNDTRCIKECLLESVINKMQGEMRIQGFSQRTIKSYTLHLRRYTCFYENYEQINIENIKKYLLHLRDEKECSAAYLSQAISSLKFYYCQMQGVEETSFYIPFPKKEKKLPNVLSKTEIQRILTSINNIKHRAILMLVYSAGLRVSEVVNLKIGDIDSDRGLIRIKQAKGRKDRYTLLSDRALETLRKYYLAYKPEEWLFPGEDLSKHISVRSVQNVFTKACNKADIKKKATVHWLRHSFSTHLLESGVDLRYIQELLGLPGIPGKPSYPHYLVTRKVQEKGFKISDY